MSKLLKIGIVGCGAIGSSLAKTILSADFSGQAKLVSLYDIKVEKARILANKLGKPEIVTLNLEHLIKRVDLVIEATHAHAVYGIARKALASSCDMMIMSVGGIIEYYRQLKELAVKKNARIFIPSGAICGVDGLKATRFGKIHKVTLTTRKPPRAFLGVPYVLKKKIRLAQIKKDIVLFKGNALSAIKAFPQNINVAATLSIAGIGPKHTVVRIVASPNAKRNIHEIEIESAAGRIITRTENVIHPDNPKTSYLAVLSAIATLKQILEPIKIGT